MIPPYGPYGLKLPISSFYVTGGTMSRDATSYVERQADHHLYEALRAGEYCHVLTARQMGKSSLMVRTAARLRESGVAVAVLDLTAVGQNLNAEQWYDGLLAQLGRTLELEDELDDYWLDHERFSPLQRWMAALGDVALARIPGPVVIFIDEIDAVRSLPFSADEFFAAIRQCYNRRTQDPEYRPLTYCLIGVAMPSDLIRDTRTTPFNVGRRIELGDFTPVEAEILTVGLEMGDPNSPDRSREEAQAMLLRILYWTGGHPYLTQRLCLAIASDYSVHDIAGVDRLCGELFLTRRARESDDNLIFVRERLLRSEADLASLLDLYRQVRDHRRVRDDETNPLCGLLKLAGAVRAVDGSLRVRNRIYQHVFDRAWVAQNMPDAEKRRQAAAYRRGVWRTLALAGAILAVVVGLAAFAFQQRNDARHNAAVALAKAELANRSAERADRTSYFADMDVIQHDWDDGKVGPIPDLLEETRNYKDRSFEWGYWNRLSHLDLTTLKGHNSRIYSVNYSPDGKRIVTGCVDKTAKLWDAATGKEILTLTGHTGFLRSGAFSPDGKRIVTGSMDNTARVWDAATGKEILSLKGHTQGVTSAVYSPDGRRIVTGSDDFTAKVWDAATGKEIITLSGHTFGVFSVAFSPDGKRIVTGSGDFTAKVWEASTGKEALSLKGHTNNILSVAFSLDGKRIVTGSGDKTAIIWDAATGKEILALKGHTSGVSGVALSPDGKSIVTGCYDGTAKVWDAATGMEILTLKGHTGGVYCVAFSPDGKRVVTGSDDQTGKVWDAATRNDTLELMGHTNTVLSAAFSPDGKRIVTSSDDKTAKVWDAETGTETLTLKGHTNRVNSAAFSSDGKRVVTGSGDKTAIVWDAETGKAMLTLRGHTEEIFSVAFSADGKRIVTGSRDKTVRVGDAATGTETLILSGHAELSGNHTEEIFSVAFSPDGKRIVTARSDYIAHVWDAAAGTEILTLKGHTDQVVSAAFSPNGKHIVTGSWDGTARVWDAATGNEILVLKGHAGGVKSAAFSPDGKRIVTGSWDNTAKVWNASTGKETLTLRGHLSQVTSVAFSPEGNRIVTGSGGPEGPARVWFSDPNDWKPAMWKANEGSSQVSLAVALVHSKRYVEAGAVYRSALRLRPALGSATFLGNLGWYEYLAGHIYDSIKSSRSALEKDSKLTYVRLNLGLSYATQDDWSKAKQEYDLALKDASKKELQAGITDVRDAIKKRTNRTLEKALTYLNRALSDIK